jgi:hypothetical protein
MRLLEFLSQSRNLAAECLFWAVRPIHIPYTSRSGGWRFAARLQSMIATKDCTFP